MYWVLVELGILLSGNHVPIAACCELTLEDQLGPKIRWAQQNSIQK